MPALSGDGGLVREESSASAEQVQAMTDPNPAASELESQQWNLRQPILERFEEAWLHGPPPSIEDFLPAAPELRPLILGDLVLIDLERRLKAGLPAEVEGYLRRFPELGQDREQVLQLILTEVQYRPRPGQLTLANYLERFPQYAEELFARWPDFSASRPAPGQVLQSLPAEQKLPMTESGPAATAPFDSPSPSLGPPAAGPVPPLPGLAGYEILQELGHGGMGVVYQARQLNLGGRLVALKWILPGMASSAPFLARFQREAQTLARLEHPHIVRIYDQGVWQGQPFLVLEYCPGGTLADRIKAKGPWPAEQAAALVETLAEAVEFAHRQGFLHRDLKPANVLFDAQDQPRLSDFGLACCQGSAGEITGPAVVVGTPAYLAPEQMERQVGPLDEKTDVFGLGTILYQLLTGQPPYQAATGEQVLERARRGDIKPLRTLNPAVPAELEQICLQALAADPARRHSSAAALIGELRQWRLRDRSRDSDRAVRATHRRMVRRSLVGGGLVCLGIVGLAIGLGFFQDHDDRHPRGRVPPSQHQPASTNLKIEEVVVRFWSPDQVKKGWSLGLVGGAREAEPGVLPARTGERFRVEVKLNQPGYIYLIMLDAGGSFIPFYPWNQNVTRINPELGEPPLVEPCQELAWPTRESGRGVKLGPPDGLETILVLVRAQPWPAGVTLREVLGRERTQPTRTMSSTEMRIRGGDSGESFHAVHIDRNRGVELDLAAIDDPLDQLLRRLEKHAVSLRALGFAHQGRVGEP